MTLASLEFDRVTALVASFARSERGAIEVRATRPEFAREAGLATFRLASEVQRLVAQISSLSFDGLDAAQLLEGRPRGLDAAELVRLVGLVRRVVEVKAALGAARTGSELAAVHQALPMLTGLLQFCEQRLGPAGEILDSASPRLAQARAGRERFRGAIVAALEQLRREQRVLQAPFTVRRERYCVPVPVTDRSAVPGIVLDHSASAATVFIEPFAVVELNNALAEAIATEREEEERILAELASRFGQHADELRRAAGLLARLDAFQARALFAQTTGAVLLEPGSGDRIRLAGVRHPLLEPALAGLRERVLGAAGNLKPVVPLSLETDDTTRLVLLSGPNAGGKTVALKTIGLTFAMASSGIPVLAEPGSTLPQIDDVWCHIGDEQNLLSDLSTFTGAMMATAALLRSATDRTLVLYDELGSGTDPEEGAALAAALLEELARRRCWTVATAHLITVAAHLEGLPGAINAAMGFDEASGRPTYAMQLGVPGRSRGLDIAASCQISDAVLERARALLSRSYLAIDVYLGRLETQRALLEEERDRLVRQQEELGHAERRVSVELERLREERERAARQLELERAALRQRAQSRLAEALAELEEARKRGEMPGKRRMATIRRGALSLGLDEETAPVVPTEPFAPGATVRVRGLSRTGQVSRVAGDRLEVVAGGKRLWVEAVECEPVASPGPAKVVATVAADTEEVPAELKLLGLTQEEARETLERFLDHALLAGIRRVRVVHGHGTGALRRMVKEVLSEHPAVAHHAHPSQARGGTSGARASARRRRHRRRHRRGGDAPQGRSQFPGPVPLPRREDTLVQRLARQGNVLLLRLQEGRRRHRLRHGVRANVLCRGRGAAGRALRSGPATRVPRGAPAP